MLKQTTLHFLKWSERYTKTDMVYLAKGGFWVGVGYFIQIVSGLIVMVAFANLLPKEAFGTYQFILAIAGILSAFTLSGMGVAITRAVAQGSESMLRTGFHTKMQWNIGIALASGVVATYYFINGDNGLALGFLVVGAFAPFLEGFRLYESFLTGKEHFKQSVLLGAWRKPLPVIALITTAFFSQDPVLLILVYFLSHTLSAGAIFLLVMRRYHIPTTTDKDASSVTYSKHLSVMRLLSVAAQHADKILLFHFLGATAVASFIIAQLPVRYTRSALNQLQFLVLPKLAKRDYQTLQETLPRKTFFFFLAALCATIAYVLISPLVFPLLFPDYSESILITQVFALTLLFIPNSMYMHTFTAHSKVKKLYIINTTIPILRILLLIILIPLYGIWGAVYAAIIPNFLTSVMGYILFRI